MSYYSLTDKELHYLSDTDFLRAKVSIYQKTDQLLSVTQQRLKEYLTEDTPVFPPGVLTRGGKISRGENYRDLPYHVLDFPRKFTRNDIFALRTMVWWGHYLSTTLHLGGDSWESYRTRVSQQLSALQSWDWKVCVGDDPWQYHQEEEYYQPARQWEEKDWEAWVFERVFCKLTVFAPLSQWEQLPEQAVIFLKRVVHLLKL